jgi:hypothetical protein
LRAPLGHCQCITVPKMGVWSHCGCPPLYQKHRLHTTRPQTVTHPAEPKMHATTFGPDTTDGGGSMDKEALGTLTSWGWDTRNSEAPATTDAHFSLRANGEAGGDTGSIAVLGKRVMCWRQRALYSTAQKERNPGSYRVPEIRGTRVRRRQCCG